MAEGEGKQATGEKKARKPWTLKEFGGKPVWDWLHLLSALAIPVVLAGVGLWFTMQQNNRLQAIEDRRAEAERELEEQRAQDEALQAYLGGMERLLLEKDLRNSEEAQTFARARTLTVLSRLDGERKGSVVEFSYEAGLIGWGYAGLELEDGTKLKKKVQPVVDIYGADLKEANLSGATLNGAELWSTDLSEADLSEADLSEADLSEANLSGTDLSGADLREANLFLAKEWTVEQLTAAKSLSGATMPDGQTYEEWLKGEEGRGEDGENSDSS